MNLGQAIETLYSIVESKFNNNEARIAIISMMGNIIHDLQNEGLPISEENLTARFEKYVYDFKSVIKSDVA